jgi:hypothetical protein
MKKLLGLLTKTRDARKEAAQGRLATAQQKLAQRVAASQAAKAALDQALAERQALVARNGAGLGADWRHTMLPSCQAVLFRCGRAAMDAAREVAEQLKVVAECRAAVTACEKALLRTAELQIILKGQATDQERLAEQSQDDDLAIALRRVQVGAGAARAEAANGAGSWR